MAMMHSRFKCFKQLVHVNRSWIHSCIWGLSTNKDNFVPWCHVGVKVIARNLLSGISSKWCEIESMVHRGRIDCCILAIKLDQIFFIYRGQNRGQTWYVNFDWNNSKIARWELKSTEGESQSGNIGLMIHVEDINQGCDLPHRYGISES